MSFVTVIEWFRLVLFSHCDRKDEDKVPADQDDVGRVWEVVEEGRDDDDDDFDTDAGIVLR